MSTTEGDQQLLQKIPQLLESELGLKNTNFEVISWIPLLYQGWELDPWAVMIRLTDKRTLLIESEHGNAVIVKDPILFLESFEKQYTLAAETCAKAKKIF